MLRYGLSSPGLSIRHNYVIETTGIQTKMEIQPFFSFPVPHNDKKMTCETKLVVAIKVLKLFICNQSILGLNGAARTYTSEMI